MHPPSWRRGPTCSPEGHRATSGSPGPVEALPEGQLVPFGEIDRSGAAGGQRLYVRGAGLEPGPLRQAGAGRVAGAGEGGPDRTIWSASARCSAVIPAYSGPPAGSSTLKRSAPWYASPGRVGEELEHQRRGVRVGELVGSGGDVRAEHAGSRCCGLPRSTRRCWPGAWSPGPGASIGSRERPPSRRGDDNGPCG